MNLLDWLLSLWPPRRKKPIDPPPPPVDDDDLLGLHNAERLRRGIRPLLGIDSRLTTAARAQAQWMAQTRSLTHSGPGGNQVGSRASASGYPWKAIAENVAAGPAMTAAQCFDAWLTDLPHAINAMNGRYADAGFASAVSGDGQTYWCAVYGGR